MEKAHSEGLNLMTLGLEETDLEEIDPKLFEYICDAYHDCAYQAEYDYMIEMWTIVDLIQHCIVAQPAYQ